MDWLSGGAILLGGLLGASGSRGGTTTANKEPWAPAQPYLLDNLKTNDDLQQWYQQNPFNAQQRTAYQNTFSDLDNFRSNVAPGLMQFANNAMTGGYQRPQYSRPGAAGYFDNQQSVEGLYRQYLNRSPEAAGAQYWREKFGDSVDANEAAAFLQAAQPELEARKSKPFSVAAPVQSQVPMASAGGGGGGGGLLASVADTFEKPVSSNYGQVDWMAQNPFTNGFVAQKAAERKAAEDALIKKTTQTGGLLSNGGGGGGGGGGGDGGRPDGSVASGGIGVGDYTDTINDNAWQAAQDALLLGGPIAAVVAGLVSKGMSTQQALDAVNSLADPIASLNALQGWTDTDPSYDYSGYGGGSSGGGGGSSGGGGYSGNGYGGGRSASGTSAGGRDPG